MKRLYLLLFIVAAIQDVYGQYIFREAAIPEKVSIISYSVIADAGYRELKAEDVRKNKTGINFSPAKGMTGNLGFTNRNYWLKFELHNQTGKALLYYLETAEPITDNVNLYLFNRDSLVSRQFSGDKLPFDKRSVAFRKTVFQIELKPGEKKEALMEVKNDGEKNNLPLNLISQENFLKITYHDQLIMGIFYGILFIIAITYLFFYFALSERIFLYYSLYVSFVGLCQFALDGFFHQYIDQDNSWLNLHAVIIFAIAGAYYFGKYSELALNIQQNNRVVHAAFRVLYVLLGTVLAGIILFPVLLKLSYPAVNILTLLGMLLILIAIITILAKGQKPDLFYTFGISVLFICFFLAILLNFGVITSFTVENITKPAIGLEIIALSLSMANRIRLLKSKKEELQAVALQRSEEMNDMKSYFLSNMSHELRTPLNAILGLTRNMESETADLKIKSDCEEIKNAAFSLISSVNDIMDFSKIEKGEIRLEKVLFLPAVILKRVSDTFRGQATNKGLEFIFTSNMKPGLRVIGDPHRLEQILNNVLSNAVKFTSQGSVRFVAEASETANGELNLLLSISDTGIGIAPEKLNTVFSMFSQADISDKRKYGGFGVGLCVVKALVDLQGGTINLSSDVKKGTICNIALVYHSGPQELRSENRFPAQGYDLLGSHVLVVEDNQMNQMVMKMMMKKWLNTTVTFASNGEESIEALKNNRVDIILMDLQMPVMDGYEATEAIRGGKAGNINSAIPIIAVTADVTEDTRDRILRLGANDFTTKPVDQSELYQKITQLLS